jgi:hypothetical protein
MRPKKAIAQASYTFAAEVSLMMQSALDVEEYYNDGYGQNMVVRRTALRACISLAVDSSIDAVELMLGRIVFLSS